MSKIIFLNPDKYERALTAIGKAGKVDLTDTEQEIVLKEYIKLLGAYLDDGIPKNIIGNPKFERKPEDDKPSQVEKVLAAQEKAEEEAKKPPKKRNMGKKEPRVPTLKPTMKIKSKKEK